MAGDFEPADDPNLAQARLLLASLWEHVGDTSRKIEAIEARVQSMTPGAGRTRNTDGMRRCFAGSCTKPIG